MRTEFTNAFPNKPLNKYYMYHGILMPCNIQPDPEPFVSYEIKPGGGPVVTVTFTAVINTGWQYSEFDYNYVHDHNEGGGFIPFIGQQIEDFGGGLYLYTIERMGVGWDTVSLPIDCTILAAKIILTMTTNYSLRQWNVVVRNGMPLYPHLLDTRGDYKFTNYSGYCGVKEIQPPGTFEIELNESGLLAVNKEGYTKFALLDDRDIAGVPPTVQEYVEFMYDKSYCKLEVTYQEAA